MCKLNPQEMWNFLCNDIIIISDVKSIYFLPIYVLIGIDLWYKYENR